MNKGSLANGGKKRFNAFLSAFFVLLLVFTSACGADEISAIAMRLQRMVGIVHLFDDKGKEKSLQEQMRLLDGDKINTDAESLVMVSLDETKLVTMEENASADILGSGKKLVFKINEGNVFINVTEKLAEGESFDVQTSNMICGIRGTSLGTGTDAEGHEYVYATDGSFIATATDEKGNTTTAEAAPGTMLTLYKGAEADNGTLSFAKRTMTVEDLPAIALDAITKSKALKERIVEATGFDEKKIEVLAKLSSKPATTMYGQAADDFKKEGVDDSMPLMGEQAMEMTASAQAARDMSNGNFEVEVAVVTGCRGVLDAGTGSGYSGAALSGLMKAARNSFKKVVDKAATDGLEGAELTEKVNKATEEIQKTAEEAVKENKTEEEIEKALDEKAEELAEDKPSEEKTEEQKPEDAAGNTEGTETGDATASEQPAEGTGNTGTGDTQEGGNTGNAAGAGDSEGPDASNPSVGNPSGEGASLTGSGAESSANSRFTDSQIEALRSIFDAEYYASLYPDVVAEYGNDPDALFKHFLEHGINEGRDVNPDFNVSAYKSSYGDLQEAYGDNIADYYLHYAENGKEEGRNLTTVEKATEAGVTVKDAVTGETISTPEAPPADPGPSSDNGSGDSGNGSGGGGGYYSGGGSGGKYTVTIRDSEHGQGTFVSGGPAFSPGDQVEILFTPDQGYVVAENKLYVSGIADWHLSELGYYERTIRFLMPENDVEVGIEYVLPREGIITVTPYSHGTVTVEISDADGTGTGSYVADGNQTITAFTGENIFINVRAEAGYRIMEAGHSYGTYDSGNISRTDRNQPYLSWSFYMPDLDEDETVNINVQFAAAEREYSIVPVYNSHGSYRTIADFGYSEGAPVLVFFEPNDGYRLDPSSIRIVDVEGNDLIGNESIRDFNGQDALQFTMPASDVTVGADFIGNTRYTIAQNINSNASVVISGYEVAEDSGWQAYEGKKITIVPSDSAPDTAVGDVMVEPSQNDLGVEIIREGTGAYFYMPASNIRLTVLGNRPKVTGLTLIDQDSDYDTFYEDGDQILLPLNGSLGLRVGFQMAGDGSAAGVFPTWSTMDPETVGLEPNDSSTYYTITPKKAGTTTVSVEADGIKVSVNVLVFDPAPIGTLSEQNGQSNEISVSKPGGGSFSIAMDDEFACPITGYSLSFAKLPSYDSQGTNPEFKLHLLLTPTGYNNTMVSGYDTTFVTLESTTGERIEDEGYNSTTGGFSIDLSSFADGSSWKITSSKLQ